MGFILQKTGDFKGSLKFDGEGDALSLFVESVKECLSQRIIDVEVDLASHVSILESLVQPILKLQKVVQPRGGGIRLVFVGGAPVVVLEELKKAGILVSAGGSISAGGRWDAKRLIELLEKSQSDSDLPEFSQFESEFLARRAELASLLRSEEALGVEVQDLRARLQLISKGFGGSAKSVVDYQEILAAEGEVTRSRDLIPGLRKVVSDAKDKVAEAKKAYEEFLKRADQENAKKLETTKKELSNLKSELDKMKKEFEKRSEARRLELKKRAQAAGGGS